MAETTLTRGVIRGDVPVTPQHVAIGDQPLQAHRAARRQGLGADAHLRTKAVAEAIGKAGGAVQKHAGTVHTAQEGVGRGGIGGADGIGVA
jgi:hypothetical protein